MNYWEIKLWDGETIKVKPENVLVVKRYLKAGEGFIPTPTRDINVKDIQAFQETDQLYVNKAKLLEEGKVAEDAARAFNEPLLTDVGAVICKPVKKTVPRRRWDKYYAQIPAYRLLDEGESRVTIGFWVPAHKVDYQMVVDCTPDDMKRM